MGEVSKDAIITTRRRARRTNIQFDSKAFDEHTKQIGEIIYLWNRLHAQLFMIFWSLTDRESHEFSSGIWHSIQSDSTQRQMVETAANLKLGKRLAGHVSWICRGHERLSRYRNAFAHVGFYAHYSDGFVPEYFSSRKSALALFEEMPKKEIFNKLRGDLMALTLYAEDVALRIFYNLKSSASPWFERPRLQLVPTTPRKPKKAQNRILSAKTQSPSRNRSGMNRGDAPAEP
ncbi:MAG: hypothetical protein ACXIVO_05065 [Glycocaulis sp.]